MKLALLQITSSHRLNENLEKIKCLLLDAKQQGAKVVVLPENFALMQKHSSEKLALQEALGNGPVQDWLQKVSSELSLWIIAGSFPISSGDKNKPFARCLVYNPSGQLVTFYDKIHLFDVELANGETYLESEDTSAGDSPQLLTIDDFTIGLSICYDLRFPELYRYYQKQGADIVLVPSAFTQKTGEQHWQLLLKARAVENLLYLAGVNQTGIHSNGRQTYGHSQLIDPWGKLVASLQQQESVLVIELSKQKIDAVRSRFPAHLHRKL